VSGSAALAEQLVRWCRRWRQDRAQGTGRGVDRIVVVARDRRLLLENLTAHDLEQLFREEFGTADGTAPALPDPGTDTGRRESQDGTTG
jgi:phosphoglycolate phosphatase-like HAD superfamily hydrolase